MKPENLKITLRRAEKRAQVDDYEHGCDPDTSKSKELELPQVNVSTVLEAFRAIVGDPKIKAEEITTIDPNVYCDLKSGGTRTVEDNQAKGLYRCTYNREENSHGKPPTKKEQEDFKAGKIKLKLADYEIWFSLSVVGLEEEALAEFLGVSNW